LNTKKLLDDITENISKEYNSLYEFFQQVAGDNDAIKDAGVDAKTTKNLEEAIKSRIKETGVKIEGKLKLASFASDGVEVIKEALNKAMRVSKEGISIKYLGAGTYNLVVDAKDYKKAEKLLEEALEKSLEYVRNNEGEGEFVRAEA